jgi:hypothetical protein
MGSIYDAFVPSNARMFSWASMNYSHITVKFSDSVLCTFSVSRSQNPPVTFVSCGVVAVTFNLMIQIINKKTKKKNSGALVRRQTIPTERPPLIGEVSANFCG